MSITEKFKALFSEGVKLTSKEAIELATIATNAVELKFVSAVSGEKSFNIEGGEVVVGAVIYLVGDDGENTDVEDGEYEFTVEGFEPFIAKVEGGIVIEVAELIVIEEKEAKEEEADAPAVEAELSDEGLESRLKAIEEILSPIMLSVKNPRDFKAEFSAMEATMLETIKVEMAKVPAIDALVVKQEFSKNDVKEDKNPNDAMISMYSRKKK